MSVRISDEKLLIFASLISPSKMILIEKKYQTFDTVFHHQMKHFEVRQKYSRLPITRTFANSNLALTRTNFRFPSGHFLYNFSLDNSNHVLSP